MSKSDSPTQSSSDSDVIQPEDAPIVDFSNELRVFAEKLDGFARAMPAYIAAAHMIRVHAVKQIKDLAREHGSIAGEDDDSGSFSVTINAPAHGQWRRLHREFQSASSLGDTLPELFIVSLISQFDSYVGRLIRAGYLVQPKSIRASEKPLTVSDLLDLNSVDAAVEFVIEKEVESVLRKSHTDQFKWLEDFLGIPLRRDLTVWADFIELTERRNLFVHSGGIVSSQYLKICGKNNADVDPDLKGTKLVVDRRYARKSYRVVREIGTKLGLVIWNKLQPEAGKQAGSFVTHEQVELLNLREADLAIELADFWDSLPIKERDAGTELYISINKLIGLKQIGDDDSLRQGVARIDWSTLAPKFLLAKACLEDDWDSAGRLMDRLSASKEMEPEQYQEWPIFDEFRKTDIFSKIYSSHYGEIIHKDFKTTLEGGVGDAMAKSKDVDNSSPPASRPHP
ncbi:MAG: hypothetical protein AAF842_02075 [Planctomycetota bacterium]